MSNREIQTWKTIYNFLKSKIGHDCSRIIFHILFKINPIKEDHFARYNTISKTRLLCLDVCAEPGLFRNCLIYSVSVFVPVVEIYAYIDTDQRNLLCAIPNFIMTNGSRYYYSIDIDKWLKIVEFFYDSINEFKNLTCVCNLV